MEAKLIVELDGGQHAERQSEDAHRTAILEKSGFRVMRFWDDEVLKNMEDVLEEILREVGEKGTAVPPL